ncbi:prepilin peptidase [Ammonifex thiophilus]|nr:A24 family peptidase [Ammonifex thiophilus]
MPAGEVLAALFLALAAAWDLRVRRVPNWLNLAGVLAGLALGLSTGRPLAALAAAAGCFLVGFLFWRWGVLGGGDAKALPALGACLGSLPAALLALALGYWCLALYLLPRALRGKGLKGWWEEEKTALFFFLAGAGMPGKEKVPFAPFLLAGFLASEVVKAWLGGLRLS